MNNSSLWVLNSSNGLNNLDFNLSSVLDSKEIEAESNPPIKFPLCPHSSSPCRSSCLSGWPSSLSTSCSRWGSRAWSRASWSTPCERTEPSPICCSTPWTCLSKSPCWIGRWMRKSSRSRLCETSERESDRCVNSFSSHQNFELKQLKKGGTWTREVNTKEINWYPLQKVNFARRKLEGANPSAITRCSDITTTQLLLWRSWHGRKRQ